MNIKLIICCGLYLTGVFISAIAQLMLKKSSSKKASLNAFTFMDAHMPKIADKVNNGKSTIFVLYVLM